MNKLKSKYILGILLLFFTFSLTSANGLQIISPTNLNITKTAGVDYFVNITIRNADSFEFKNIQFLETLKTPPFSLLSGENRTILFRIDSDQNIDKELRLRGYFESAVGESNKTEVVTINSQGQIDKCNVNIIMGDRVVWQNNFGANIQVRNTNGNLIAEIPKDQSYTYTTNSPHNFDYRISLISGIFVSPTCNINVMNTSGIIHNTQYDALLPTKLTVSYPSTTIETTFLQTTFNLTYNAQYQDVFSVRNTGDKVAKNIKLSGDWMIFSVNDFDLQPGESRNVGLTIKPAIFNKEETGITHFKNINVKGNFPDKVQNLTIHIEFANIGSIGNITTLDPGVLQYLLQKICEDHPEFEECKRYTDGGNLTVREVSAIFDENTILELIKQQILSDEKEDTYKNQQNELIANLTNTLNLVSNELIGIKAENENLSNKVDNASASSVFLGIIFLVILLLSGFTFIILKRRGKLKIFTQGNFHTGEQQI